jgi:hypothetical protein
MQTALLLLADYKDELKANPDTDDKDELDRMYDYLVAAKDAYFTAVLSQSVMRGIAEVADAVSNFNSTSKQKYFYKKSAEFISNTALPALGMSKQVGDITSPVKKEAIEYIDYLKNSGGGYTTWLVDRPKFDWRGRQYATGDLYASNLRSILGLEPILKADNIDQWALDKGIKTTTPKTEYDIAELEEDRQIFALVPDNDGPNMLLDPYQNYDFRKSASDIFDKKLRYLWDRPMYKNALISLSKEEAQNIVNQLWSDSKLESLYEMNKKVSPNVMKSDYPTIEEYKKRNNRFKAIKTDKQVQNELLIKEGVSNQKQ